MSERCEMDGCVTFCVLVVYLFGKKRFKIFPVLYYHISPYFFIHNLLMLFMKLCILI